jgi:N-hydroxyarylamine O-acetyltransferase
MSHSPFHLDAYLERIHYDGPLSLSEETLRRLHRAQAMNIPFENLDIFLGRSIRLDPASLASKLVEQRRGGYCHELNGLLLLVLRELGFTVTPLAARVFNSETPLQQSHQLLLVEIAGERWLADVGFGSNGLIEAIPLEVEREFPQRLDTFRVKTDPKLGFVMQHKLGDHWRSLYSFSLQEYYPADYRMMTYFTSTSPDSLFTQHIICTLPTDEARIILYDSELKIRRLDETITTNLEDKDTYRETLQRYFGIVLPPETRLQSPYSQFHMLL